MQTKPVITLTTDFGLDDPFVGVMKGVILNINPRSTIIDLNHGISSHDIREAAFTIGMNYKFFPARTAHVVVVDPGVGSRRRPILVVTGTHYFIGPDNGVFSYVFEKERGSLRIIHITAGHYFLKPVSPTFQGRDVFAPVAAWLTSGKNFRNFGEEITDYETIDLSMPVLKKNALRGEIILIDKFGNAMTNINQAEISALMGNNPGKTLKVVLGKKVVPLSEFYGQATGKGIHAVINSSEYLEFFVNRGSAAKAFKISIGDAVEIKLTL
jgi:S-adenosylmethionine hydrolase